MLLPMGNAVTRKPWLRCATGQRRQKAFMQKIKKGTALGLIL